MTSAVHTVSLHAIRRRMDPKGDYRSRGAITDDEALRWAATRSDRELLAIRNIGPRSLAWIREHEPPGPAHIATTAKLARTTQALVEAAVAERAAEQDCRDRPWDDRAAWLRYVEALEARRAAVDRLVREAQR